MGYGGQGLTSAYVGYSCNMACPNDANQICGEGNAISIYTSGSCPSK